MGSSTPLNANEGRNGHLQNNYQMGNQMGNQMDNQIGNQMGFGIQNQEGSYLKNYHEGMNKFGTIESEYVNVMSESNSQKYYPNNYESGSSMSYVASSTQNNIGKRNKKVKMKK